MSNCNCIAYQEQQSFKCHWLVIFIGTYGSLELALLMCRVVSPQLNAQSGFKPVVMRRFILPESVANLPCLVGEPHALNAPLIGDECPQYLEMYEGRLGMCRLLGLMGFGFVVLTLEFVAMAALFELWGVMSASDVHELVDAVCASATVMNITNPEDLWANCKAGNYEGEALLESFESAVSFCSDICSDSLLLFVTGQAGAALLQLMIASWVILLLVGLLMLFCRKALSSCSVSTNMFSTFSNLLDNELLRLGQKDANDNAIANTVLEVGDIEAGAVLNPIVDPGPIYQPPML